MKDAYDVINRVKNLRYHEISIEMPPDFQLSGKMPFTFRICNNVATFKVLALNETEAEFKLFEFLNSMDDNYE